MGGSDASCRAYGWGHIVSPGCHHFLLKLSDLLSGAFDIDALLCQSELRSFLEAPLYCTGVTYFLLVLIGCTVAWVALRYVSS